MPKMINLQAQVFLYYNYNIYLEPNHYYMRCYMFRILSYIVTIASLYYSVSDISILSVLATR